MSLISLLLTLATLFFMGKTFEKMGRKLWEGIIPLYNFYVLISELQKPIWWFILLFIPIVNIAIVFMLYNELAKRFSRDYIMALVMLLFPFIGFGILAYSSDAVYRK